jgi:hypothetical protein
MMRLVIGLALLLGSMLAAPGAARAQCSPNPNLTPGNPATFVDGCALPAAGLNAAFAAVVSPGIANFSATPIYAGNTSSSLFTAVLGSIGTPNATENAALIVQKIATGTVTGTGVDAGAYFSTQKTGSTNGQRATGIMAEGYDNAGGNGTFVEGGRFHGTLGSGATSGQAGGVVCLAQSTGSTGWDYLIGCEAAVEIGNFDQPASGSFNASHFAADFVATVQNPSSHIIDASFIVNPNNAKSARVGFLVPAGAAGVTTVTDSAFRSAATSVYGIDLGSAVNSSAAVKIANDTPVVAVGAGGLDVNLLYLASGSNSLILGTGTEGITLPAVTAPATPGSGFFDIYMSGADNKLHAKGPGGTDTVLAVP